ncbi:MAG: phosphoribosyl-ATP diphosphatase [Planctomycetes bacterium]|nr:phosphoribosyl-ATP diphosphatase [Planctomycetota bacterium]
MPTQDILDRLAEVIGSRRRERPDRSYVVRLLDGGIPEIGAKVTEEARELVLAAAGGDREHVAREAADLFFHALVLLEAAGVALADVRAVLAGRFGVGGIEEKEARGR